MKNRNWAGSGAFTLIELLVVVAIIALLLSILLPSLSGAREQGKKAKCLSNLSGLGKAVYQYSNEDRAEQIVPIHENMVQACDYWEFRCINWFAWGGRSGQIVFKTSSSGGPLLTDQIPLGGMPPGAQLRPKYAAKRRPLNNYMLTGVGSGDDKKMEWYSCPSDVGYPDDPMVDDAPLSNCKRPCYDSLGNSYRASLACYMKGLAQGAGAFAFGPWGHRSSSLQDLARTILFGEPSWFNMIGQDNGIDSDTKLMPVEGWHKRVLIDNLVFCDGSARATKVEVPQFFDDAALAQMGVTADAVGLLKHRCGNYKLDVYPIGGAIIWGDWSQYIGSSTTGQLWPWRGFQDNLRGH